METLQPAQEPVEKPTGFNNELEEAGITYKNLTFLSSLGLKDELDNPEIMGKVDYLASKLELEELTNLDLKLGYDDTPRIDKIFSYVKLLEMEENILKEQELIRNQRHQYEQSN